MRLELLRGSRVLVDLQATGLLRAVGHDPTLVAVPQPVTLDVVEGAEVSVVFPVRDIEVPPDLSASDRDKMLEHLRGPEVLDAARHPSVTFRARYTGAAGEGRGVLDGQLAVRGAWHPLRLDVVGLARAGELVVTGTWEGTLTSVGVKPFKALLGALKLKDWLRIRLEVRLREASP